MADEEAEQESGGSFGGGELLELRRLRERLVELETGLRESPEPAVQAATEYCKQLCQMICYLGRNVQLPEIVRNLLNYSTRRRSPSP